MFLIFICFLPKLTYSNPSVIPFISEVYFDDNDKWTIELCNIFGHPFELNNCRIMTSTDSAIVKRGTKSTGNFLLLTVNDLEKAIKLNRSGDYIYFEVFDDNDWNYSYDVPFKWGKFNNEHFYYTDLLVNYPDFSPKKGQSICAITGSYFRCPIAPQISQEIVLSSKPTLGYDFYNATTNCSISGCVKDNKGNPLPYAWVSIEPIKKPYYNLPVQTDSNGCFSIKNLFIKKYRLKISIPQKMEVKNTVRKSAFNSVYEEDIIFTNDSNAILNIVLKNALPKQENFENEFNLNLKVISDTEIQFSTDSIKTELDKNSIPIVYLFIADKYGKIIYNEPLFSYYNDIYSYKVLWNIYDRIKLDEPEYKEDNPNLPFYNKYKSQLKEESNEYYYALIPGYFGGPEINFIKKFKIGK